jgi:uncharacterized protein (DUF58 family)
MSAPSAVARLDVRRTTSPVRRAFAPVTAFGTRLLSPVTTVGWSVAGVAALAWVGAWLLGWQELAYVAAGCVIAMAVSYAFTLGQARLDVDLRMHPARVVVGERAGGRMAVRSAARRRMLPIRVELPVGRGLAGFHIPSLGPDDEHEEIFLVPTQRRSVIDVGPVSSVRGDPLGLVRRVHTWTGVEPLYVHPRTLSLEQLGAGFLRDLEGQATRDLSMNDVAFHTLREYVPGDDRRYVHWRTTARLGRLMVRQFIDTRRSHLSVVVSGERADYASEDEFEAAVSIGASLALRALRDEQDVTVVYADRPLPTVSGQRLLDAFAAIELGANRSDLTTGVRKVAQLAPQTSIAILVSGQSVPIEVIRSAASALGPDVTIVVMRVDGSGRGGLAVVGNTTVVALADLDELPMAVKSVMR